MLIISPSTANAMSPHAGARAPWWVMFVQAQPPAVTLGPILIEPVAAIALGARLGELDRNNAYPTYLIGLVEAPNAADVAAAIREQYAGKRIHHDWYEPTADLIAYIQHTAQAPIKRLLSLTHPGALSTEAVGVDELAEMLGCSTATVRRMVKAEQIPYMRWGQTLRFVPAEVVASLQRRRA